MNKIITIGREFGSGGRELGRRLAQELGIAYYDKEIITAIADKTSLTEHYIQQTVENRPQHMYSINVSHNMAFQPNYQMKQMQDIYGAQTKIIHELAEKSDCVIIGRCADYILRDEKPFRLFVHADLDVRVQRCMDRRTPEEANVTEAEMRKRVRAIDKARAAYYNDFTGLRWGDVDNYDVCLNTTNFVIEEIAPTLAKLF